MHAFKNKSIAWIVKIHFQQLNKKVPEHVLSVVIATYWQITRSIKCTLVRSSSSNWATLDQGIMSSNITLDCLQAYMRSGGKKEDLTLGQRFQRGEITPTSTISAGGRISVGKSAKRDGAVMELLLCLYHFVLLILETIMRDSAFLGLLLIMCQLVLLFQEIGHS